MKAFAATLLIVAATAAEAESWHSSGYGSSLGGYSHGYASKLVRVPGPTLNKQISKTVYDQAHKTIHVPRTSTRARTVYDNVQQKIPQYNKRTVWDQVEKTVWDNVSKTVIDNVPRQVIDEITKTVIDNVPRKVMDQVQSTSIRLDRINESNDSGDGMSSDERIYVASQSSDSSDDYCGWGGCNKWSSSSDGCGWNGCQSSSSSDGCGWAGCNKWDSSSDSCGWNGCSLSDTSYIITSDSSSDEKIIRTPVTTTKNVMRTVIDKVPRQVKSQRARTVIDQVPRQVNMKVPRKVTKNIPRTVIDKSYATINKRVPRTVLDTVTTLHPKTISKMIPRTVTKNISIPTSRLARVSKPIGGYSLGGYSSGYSLGGYGKKW